ncbi:LapA family protein [Pararobbsia alpina]|uniref:Lipopolysaccharide assembly protein A n=1 Tax=Pararobbsia alpina TaxID=621374 RepID=A0A6S7C586_9BURK|nr:LapA family protein [Pararobbsia alpina]CAB3781479.1 Lipopolysaccharide assembly protein A [Pararobbsia alpina]
MRFIVWLLRALVFVVLLILALANTQEASLNFVAGYAWQAPLILLGLVFFAVGLFAGVLAAAPALVRMRLENARLRRQIKNAQNAPVVLDEPPLPPII